jgi:hypothetical protein
MSSNWLESRCGVGSARGRGRCAALFPWGAGFEKYITAHWTCALFGILLQPLLETLLAELMSTLLDLNGEMPTAEWLSADGTCGGLDTAVQKHIERAGTALSVLIVADNTEAVPWRTVVVGVRYELLSCKQSVGRFEGERYRWLWADPRSAFFGV